MTKMSYKDWIVVLLTAVFVLLYGLAFAGVLQPLDNDKLVGQVAPIISVIIGYYFGRLPADKTEQNLQQAQQERNEAVGERERLSTKIAGAKAALNAAAPTVPPQALATTLGGTGSTTPPADAIRQAAVAALKVLEAT
jgi:hypothetical protein